MTVNLKLYTRIGCHLCEEMEQELPVLEKKLNFNTDVIVINENPLLEANCGDQVPVLAHEDNIICRYVINEKTLSKALKQYS